MSLLKIDELRGAGEVRGEYLEPRKIFRVIFEENGRKVYSFCKKRTEHYQACCDGAPQPATKQIAMCQQT